MFFFLFTNNIYLFLVSQRVLRLSAKVVNEQRHMNREIRRLRDELRTEIRTGNPESTAAIDAIVEEEFTMLPINSLDNLKLLEKEVSRNQNMATSLVR